GCGRTGAVSSSARVEPSTARGPSLAVHFTDVTAAAGIRFRHTTGGFGRKLMPETMGSGCAFLDYDGDGHLDILLLNGRPLGGAPKAAADRIPTLALYRNRGDGTFRDVTRAAGLAVPMYGMGCCAADYDNDGDADLYVTCALGPSHLFRNNGDGTFTDVT